METKDLNRERAKNGIIDFFKDHSSVSINEIRDYFKHTVPGINDNAVRARIYELKKKGILASVGKGIYTFSPKPLWVPQINKEIKKLSTIIKKQFGNTLLSIWDTAWLNEFTNLQSFRFMIIIEPEEIVAESLFYYLKENGIKNVYYRPDTKEIEYYTQNEPISYIVKPLISKSPFLTEEINTPALEKILVDLFCDKSLFISYQGEELINIWENAFKKYLINLSVLNHYSRRRGKQNEIKAFYKTNSLLKN